MECILIFVNPMNFSSGSQPLLCILVIGLMENGHCYKAIADVGEAITGDSSVSL